MGNIADEYGAPEVPDHPGLKLLFERLDSLSADSQPADPNIARAWRARCPSHDDRNPSLSVCLWTNSHVTVKCWAGCDVADVLGAIDVKKAQLRAPAKPRARMVAAYGYHDHLGRLLFRVVRYEPKDFRMERPDGKGGWTRSMKGVRRVIFRLPRVKEAIARAATVFVCEGEKDALRLENAGVVATCNPNGASSWRAEYAEMLRGADAVLLPDNDGPGHDLMQAVARSLHGVAATVKLVQLADLPEGGDVSDWLDAGHSIQDLAALVAETPILSPSESVAVADGDAADREKYAETEHGLFRRTITGEMTRIANFTARITHELIEDDGAETNVSFEVESKFAGVTRKFVLTPVDFVEMNWHIPKVAARAAIMPSGGPAHVRYAIQLFSQYQTTTVYGHTGWRKTGPGEWVFLHAGGAIGRDGPVPNIRVQLDDTLDMFRLPDPPPIEDARSAVRASLHILKVAPARIAVPLLGGVWRAPLGPVDMSLQVAGGTGVLKTELAARMQQHFGLQFDSRRLVGSWSSTANALEGLLFRTKDVLVVIDDFAPGGSENAVRQMHQQADRIFRAQGNAQGRSRMRSDTSLRPAKPPRGLILSTGEDVATRRSGTARTAVIEVDKDDVDKNEMRVAQSNGAQGLYARGMSAYIQYLAQHHDELEQSRAEAIAELHRWGENREQHPRTPEIIANLLLGWRWFLRFVRSIEALPETDIGQLESEVWNALVAVAELQLVHHSQEAPGQLALDLLSSALDSGAAHIEDIKGGRPAGWRRLGWQKVENPQGSDSFRTQGARIGFRDGMDVYLIPRAAHKVAREMARGGPQSLALTERMLHKSLFEEQLLKSTEQRGGKLYYTARKQIGSRRVPLLHIAAESLGIVGEEERDESAEPDAYEM